MSLQVFACPECTQPFQVDSSQAGQQVRCPSCNAVAEIPNSDPAPAVDQTPAEQPAIADQGAPSSETSEQPQPFRCPGCSNVFGVLASMFGSTMACPHCQQPVVIGAPPTTEEPTPTPPAKQRPTKQQPTKKRKRPTPQQAANKISTANQPPIPPPIQSPTRPPIQPNSADDAPAIAPTNIVPDSRPEEYEDLPEDSSTAALEPLAPMAPMAPAVFEPQPVAHLLPPRFETIDPAFFYRANRNGDQVLLPTADGNVKAVSNRIVTIVHNGQAYQLISSPRYRAIQNAVVNALLLFIAAVLLFAIYWTVTS